jgi:8-oxo-dGTP pyrophosphatase MutT (NUDIX family)
MNYKDFYKELLMERILTESHLNQEVEVGDLVNIKNNRGGGGWEVVKIEGDNIFIAYGYQMKPTPFPRSELYVIQKRTSLREIEDILSGEFFKGDKPELDIDFKVKDYKVLGGNEWIELRELENNRGKYTYSYEIRCNGKIAAILPYRRVGRDSYEICLREEITPCWNSEPSLSSVTGGIEENEPPKEAARRELLEETGYEVSLDDIKELGICRGTKSTDTIYYLFSVDLTGVEDPREPAKGDGTVGDAAPIKWMYMKDSIIDPMVYVMYHRSGI